MHNQVKIVVFDMDETLGYFVEFGIFWEAIHSFFKGEMKMEFVDSLEFYDILNLYPEFIRPNIYSILNYLKHKMMVQELDGIMIYTNNQGPRVWVHLIKDYFEKKINYPLFTQIIAAFKVNGKQVEMGRTTNDKTLDDFFRCTRLPTNAHICFLDDCYYPNMHGDNVYYIKVRPYIYDLSFEMMIRRFLESDIGQQLLISTATQTSFKTYVLTFMTQFKFLSAKKTKEEYEIDKIVTKKTMVHLQTFFAKNKTYPILKHKIRHTTRSKSYKNRTLRKL
uniref:Uncharacterized protein n=1 Tax=viral metagenome TaxID=1070528 RepID=A0A6C0LEK5_9ZZZZ